MEAPRLSSDHEESAIRLRPDVRERPPLARVRAERGRWVARTLETPREIEAALRLRHDVFHVEHWNRRLPSGLDVDSLDEVCDHVGVFEGGRLIGCYRLACSLATGEFYASRRFDLSELKALPGVKLELGRACVAPDRRVGAPLLLLWAAIRRYADAVGASLLFGSASVRTHDVSALVDLCRALEARGAGSGPVVARTRKDCVPSGLSEALASQDEAERRASAERGALAMSPLFEAYLRAGARACGPPALDRFMGSADFLMAVPLGALSEQFERRYLREASGLASSR